MGYIQKGTPSFRNTNLAFFAAGFSTYANLYCVQPLLPEFTKEFNLSPAYASLSLSLTTLTLAIAMLITGSISESWGRKPIMVISMFAVSVLTILAAFASSFEYLLAFRILQGIVFAGLPSIAMAFLSEEIDPHSLGIAMGMYISGNSVGGLSGRIITGMVTTWFDWHTAIIAIGVLSIGASILFVLLLPASQHFEPQPLKIRQLFRSMISHLKDPGLLCLYGVGFLLMGSFVTIYNYLEFQLVDPPYSLSKALVSWIFILYLLGTVSSAWMGKLADKYGSKNILIISILLTGMGALTTLNTLLLVKIIGVALFTFGFFGGHSISSSWVGQRAAHDKAQASSLYLFFYYAGSSIGGTLGGIFWSTLGWSGVISMITLFLIVALSLGGILYFKQTKNLRVH